MIISQRWTAITAGLLLVLLTLWLGSPWNGVPVIHSILGRWAWLTSRRPFFGAGQSLSLAASSQVVLAVVLLTLLVAALPRVPISRVRTVSAEDA